MRRDEQGQAVVEYMLMIGIVLAVISLMAYGLKGSLLNVWQSFSRDISAACPRGCPPPSNVQFR